MQFIHLSVNDFLLRNKRLQTLDQALEPNPVTASHRRLWVCCWSHIRQVSSTITKEAYKELRREYPFLGYAASYILDHAEKVLDEGVVGQAGVTIEKWLRDGSSWFEWWKSFLNATRDSNEHYYNYLNENMDAGLLYMLSLRGYGSLVKCMLAEDGEDGAEVNAQGGEYGNALQAASYQGHQEIVKLLLKKGAEVNAQGGEYGNALQAASARGEQETVKLLLEKGAEVNAQGGEYGNALQAASRAGYKNIVAILSTAGSIVNTKDLHEDNPPKAFLTEPSQDAIRTTSKEQSIYKAIWRHIILRTAFLWPGLVFAIIGGLILRLTRGRRIILIVSKVIRRISIQRRYNR